MDNILNFFSIFLSLVLCIGLQIVMFVLFFKEARQKQTLYASILLVLNINLLMQMTIPLIMGVFYSFSIEKEFNISLVGLFEVVLVQFVYLGIFLITFLYKKKPQKFEEGLHLESEKVEERKTFLDKPFDNKMFIFIILGMYLLAISFSVSGIAQSVMEAAGGVQKQNSFADIINIYLRTMFEWTALVCAILYIFTGRGPKIIKLIVIVFCVAIVLRQLALGLRGGVFIISILILFVSYLKNNSIDLKKILPIVILLVPIFGFLGGSFREDITSGFLVEADTFERVEIVVTKIFSSDKKVKTDEKSFSESVYSRLEATRNSVSLIKTFNDGDFVQFKPLISAVTALIPQSITGLKNYATSSTDDVSGTAMYEVRAKTYGYTDMGPFLTSAHEYWEGGPLYVIFSAFILGLIWRKLTKLVIDRNYDTISLVILISILDAHHGEMSIAPPLALVIRLFYFQILPTMFVIYMMNKMIKYSKIKLKKQTI